MATDRKTRSRVLLVAASAQVCKLLLAIAANQVLKDYDTSATLNAGLCAATSITTGSNAGVRAAVQELRDTQQGRTGLSQAAWSLIVWDSVFLTRIACKGYEYEQEYAFFPLLPALLRPWRSHPAALPVAALLMTSAATICAAALLHSLTVHVTRSTQLASMSSLLYIFNPASIFHTAAYTEGSFGALSLLGLCALYTQLPGGRQQLPAAPQAHHATATGNTVPGSHSTRRSQQGRPVLASNVADAGTGTATTCMWLWAAGVCFTLASAARSNGVVNAGFLLHVAIQTILNRVSHVAAKQTSVMNLVMTAMQCAMVLASAAGAACMTFAPLALHQLHAHAQFCSRTAASNPALQVTPVGRMLRLVMAVLWEPALAPSQAAAAQHSHQATGPAWCYKQPAWWPAVYSHVQSKYWGVGLFQYWRISQVPNFLLAAPVLTLAVACITAYARQQTWHVLLGGFIWPSKLKNTDRSGDKHASAHVAAGKGAQEMPVGVRWRSPRLTAHVPAQQQQPTPQQPPQANERQQVGDDKSALLQDVAHGGKQAADASAVGEGMFCQQAAVFMYPLAFMATCAVLVMHVQVATRFMSSSPPLYWYMAHLLLQGQQAVGASRQASQQGLSRLIWGWCWGYILVGTVLFTSFLPWT